MTKLSELADRVGAEAALAAGWHHCRGLRYAWVSPDWSEQRIFPPTAASLRARDGGEG